MYNSRLEQFRKIAFSGGGQEVVAAAYLNDLTLAEKDLEKYNSSIFASQDIDVSPDFNFKQIMPGQPAIKPEPGKGLAIISIAGLSMFFLSIFFIIILELLDTSLRTPSIFRQETKLNVLATVGTVELDKKSLNEYFDFARDRETSNLPFIDNLRKLRYEIECSGRRIILFTSTKPDQGKTIIIEALAHTLSLSKKKVLLIDSNFGNNSLTRDFSAKTELVHFAGSETQTFDQIRRMTSATNIPAVEIIGCEEGNYTPGEILTLNHLPAQFEKLKNQYDFVLIEAAALNAHADSREWCPVVEAVVLVFSAKTSLGDIDKESIAFLSGTGTKFIGAVLNHVDEQNLDL